MKLNLLVVGESPSKKDPDGVLDNSQSGKRLEQWLEQSGALQYYAVYKVNAFNATTPPRGVEYEKAARRLRGKLTEADVVLVLGSKAARVVSKVRGDFISFLHPSGRNRKLNDAQYVANQLAFLAYELRDRYLQICRRM